MICLLLYIDFIAVFLSVIFPIFVHTLYVDNANIRNIFLISKKNIRNILEETIMSFDLKKFRKEKRLSQKELANILGIGQSFVSQIENGKDPMPETLKQKLISTFGEIEHTSKPEISQDEPNLISIGRVIPYYDAEVAAGTTYSVEMTQARPSGMIEIGGLMKDSEFALRVYGNSMVPNYPAGCVIGLKQYNESFIEPGTVYVVETSENRYLKRLYYNKEKSAFRCLSDNHMKHESGPMTGEYFYPEFEIPFEDVRRLLRVTGVIKRNIM